MKTKISKYNLIRRGILFGSIAFLSIAIALIAIFTSKVKVKAESFFPYTASYESNQEVISSSTKSNDYVTMTEANSNGSVATGKIVSISTPQEFKLFTDRCEQTSAFLTYNYELMTDIDFAQTGVTNIIPIGYNTPFSGTFNGNGYALKNMPLLDITANNHTDYQFSTEASNPVQYYALFSKNSGTICNLGIENPEITVSYTPSGVGLAYVAPFVGLNTGIVHHCYTKETRDRTANNVGIYTQGGFYVSGFASINNGTIHDVYTSRTILSTTNSQGMIAQAEILNDGTAPTSAYFYDSTITNYTGSAGAVCTILFNSNFVNQNILNVVHYGTYSPSNRQLTIDVVSNDTESSRLAVGSWYNLSSYSIAAQTYFKDSNGDWIYGTPISRGIAVESNLTFTISSNREFSYMYELFSLNKSFATSVATFKITSDIDMGTIYAPKYYTSDIGCNIVGAKNNVDDTAVTIYNAPITEYYSKTLGIDCFGVFPWLTGSVSYINVVLGSSSSAYNFTFTRSNDTNKLAIGAISGYVDGGKIENCNVYINISFDNAIGKYYFGGIAGMIGSSSISVGNVKKSTINGNINQTNTSVGTVSETVNYLDGMVLGGAVGYLDYTTGTVDEVLSKVNITATGVTNKPFAVGGVVGAGYSYKLNKLQYQANIDLNSSSIAYSKLYVSGITGRLLGIKEQADYLTNYGDIDLYQKTNTETYISGIMNVEIITPTSQSTYTPVSNNPLEAQGAYYFYGASFTNKSDISISNISSTLAYTEVLNVKSSNGFTSEISGLYNLEDTNDISIDILKIQDFAPVLNNIGGSTNYKINLQTAYNFEDIVLTTSAAITTNTIYAGVAKGEYINFKNVHNLGNITATISNQYGTNGSRKNLIISGVFNEVSAGCTADMIYNAGNITINYSANFYGDIYASGICYANKNGFDDTEIQKFDPASDKHQSDATGSINNTINNGQIEVTNPAYANISYATYEDIKSANGNLITERHYHNNDAHPSASLYGDTNVSGIVNYNYSVITNTFNIADLFAANYIRDTQRNEINVSGLVTYNIGKYAVIENSANDGVIKAINLSFYMVFSNGQTSINKTYAQYAFVNASGIVCHNDENEDGSIYSNGGTHSKQIIAFTINYGSIYSYNVARNAVSSAESSFRTISAGILGMGLLNLVNVVNYGNIYGSEVSGGIVGVMFFSSFNTEVTSSNKVTLANTINYANVLVIDKGELGFRDSNTYYPQNYTSFRALTISSTCYHVNIDVYSKDYFNGSIFGIINFAGNSNAVNVIIRYLISFNKDVSLVGAEAQTPTVDVDLSTFYSAYIHFDGSYTLDTYIGLPVVYSPLATGSEKINGTTYYGVFNDNFSFRKAMAGEEGYLDIVRFPTDSFISDYFEFVGSTYVNETLLNTIGWGTLAYNAAAETFATSLSGVSKFVQYINEHNSSQYNSLITDALNTDTWLSKCDEETLVSVIEELLNNESESELLSAIQYIFTIGSATYSLISAETRGRILELLLENDSSLNYESLLTYLIDYAGGYSSLLANSVIDNDGAGEYLRDYLSSLSQSALKNILVNYCTYLNSSSNNSYFTYGKSQKERYDILSAIFKDINNSTFYTTLASVLGISTEVSSYGISDELDMYNGYSSLSEESKIAFYKAILIYNSQSNFVTYINEMDDEINYYLRIINNGYMKTSLSSIYTDVSSTATSSSVSVIDERVALWNQIRNTEVFKSYLSGKIGTEYVAKATEVNNTYQTTTYPYWEVYSTAGDLSFVYTFNITPAVYFLGPYMDTSKNQRSYVVTDAKPTVAPDYVQPGTYTSTRRTITDVTTLAEANFLYNNGYTYEYKTFYYEYSDSSSNNQLCAVEPTAAGDAKYAFTWLKTSNTTDFTGGYLNGTYHDDGSWDSDSVYATDNQNVTFDVNGGGISKFTCDTGGTTGEANYASNLDKTGSWIITDSNQKAHTITGTMRQWANFIIAHETRHYIAYPTTALHSTQATGVFKNRSGNKWFTWYATDRYVWSTQYIDYNVNQLLALDGYLTSYGDGSTKSDDERTIINDLFNTYFVTDSTNFQNMVAAALLEKNAIIDNDSYYYVGTPTFNNTNKVYYTIVANVATSYENGTKYYSRVGNVGSYNYLEVDSSKVNNSNYSNYYTLTATRVYDYYNYTDCYQMKDVDDYDIKYIDEFVETNIYTSTTINTKKPFEFLNYSSALTVKEYLKNLQNEVSKEQFMAYCVDHQNAYAKLLLKLLELDTINSTTISFPVNIGNSNDVNSIAIENINSYQNLGVVNTPATIEGEIYSYGYTFSELQVSLSSQSNRVRLYVKPTGASATLTYTLNGESAQSITATTARVIEINLNNNSLITLTSNQDLILYAVKEDENIELSGTFTYTCIDSTNLGVGQIIYQLPSENQILNMISSRISNSDLDISYTVYANVQTHNNSSYGTAHYGNHRLIIDDDGSFSTSDGIVIATSSTNITNNMTYTFDAFSINEYLGSSLGVLKNSNGSGSYSYYTEKRGNGQYRVRFYSIILEISYVATKYNENDLLTRDIVQDSIVNASSSSSEEYIVNRMRIQANYQNQFSNFILDATYNLLPIDYAKQAYINTLTSNTYYVENSGVYSFATGVYDSTKTYYTESGGVYSTASINESTYYSSMTSNKYYVQNGNSYIYATGAYNSNTTYYTYDNTEYEEASLASMNLIDLLGLNETHSNNDYCIPELIEKLLTTSNEAFLAFVNSSVALSSNSLSDYKCILKYLVENVGYYCLDDFITSLGGGLANDSKNIIASAYMVTDYRMILKNETSVYDSVLRGYIDNNVGSDYRYIQSTTPYYDKDKFEDFAQLIGYSLATTGYGIYALASSYGIEDGRFIPDNLVLSSMDAHYDSSHQITSGTNSYWRRGTGATDDAVTDTSSVNYAFFEEMKQLKKSISTAIIELDLTDGTNTYMSNSNQTSKRNNEGTITYYVTEAELTNITTTLTISNVAIANKAKLYIVNGSSETLYSEGATISVTKNGNSLTTTNQFKVVAEDTTVYTYYDIEFVVLPSTDTYTLLYSDDTNSKTYGYTGGTVNLKFTSEHLPANMDLTPYITISKTGASYNYLVNKELFQTYFSYYTYGKYQVTDNNGDAKIKLEVFQALPAGTYTITVRVGSVSASVTLIKNASTERNIVEFEFDNATVSLSGTAYASTVLFGRTFNKADLEIPSGTKGDIKPAYLSKFEISPNATYEASASYAYNNTTHLVIYTITYTITSESGDTKEYTHTITELAPYSASESFATEYMNGDTYSTNTSYTTTSADSNNVLSGDATISISFSRDLGTPEFRTYYNLSHFYISSGEFIVEDVSNTYSSIGSGSGVAAIGAPYAGITATITNACDVGTYVFRYTYVSESTWGSDTLERRYIFPLIYITKEASTDSWISNISFLDNFKSEGSSATKFTYEHALIPNENTPENRTLYHYDSNEVHYQGYSNTQGITINTAGDITYQNAVKVSNKNYYVLGNVSDASLASYAPTMTINGYSEVYQYLTEEKANGTYGLGQTTNDTGLLNTDGSTTIYLYLPYYIDTDSTTGESAEDTYEIFLVKMTVSQAGVKSLTEVYRASDGIYSEVNDSMVKNTPIHTFTGLILDKIHSSDNTFTIGTDTYTISEYCGKPGNSSLYMNYIGNPEEGHFWYVSYAVFSESYLKSSSDTTHVDFYHISIIDLTNNIYFTIKVNVPNGFENDAIFMTINYVTYDTLDTRKENAVSVYAIVDSQNSSIYIPQYELAMLPSGYYTFTLELAPGYVVSYTASRLNNIEGSAATHRSDNTGAYFPPSSVVPIQIDLVFTVEVDSQAITTTNLWGMGTSSTETVTATYSGAAATITQKSTSAEVNTNLTNLVSSSIKGTYVFTLNGSTVTKVQSGENTYEYTFTPQDNRYVATIGTITVTGITE